ncbi:MAG: proline--tRNA ligase, partial [Alicyclobacillus sp.]|nr:proline--tRNA ligase [Alicyclobacillus sp.]
LDLYTDFVEGFLAIPVYRGQKTPLEKFAGAVETYSIEAMMKDGRALQAGTSHYLGQNFAKGFQIQFLDKDNTLKFVYTTSWGVSTRLLGALIMVHGDDRGLALPPQIAPTQIMIIPIGPQKERERVVQHAQRLYEQLQAAGLRVKIDAREDLSPGWKFNEYEMRGIPLRLEIGPRDLENNQVVLVRRDTGEKLPVPESGLLQTLPSLLQEIQQNMFQRAKAFRDEHSHVAETLAQLCETIQQQRGFVLTGWCGQDACEQAVKEACGATSRNIPMDPPARLERCAICGQTAVHSVWFAKSY